MIPMARLTSVYGSFRAGVMAARLEDEGIEPVLRGATSNPYALTVGDMARIDVYVPEDQLDDAMLVLLASEIDEADIILDDDRPPVRDPRVPASLVVAAVAFVLLAAPIALVLRWY
jgi:hypothetical protein